LQNVDFEVKLNAVREKMSSTFARCPFFLCEVYIAPETIVIEYLLFSFSMSYLKREAYFCRLKSQILNSDGAGYTMFETMNLGKAIELLKILTACSPESKVKIPEIRIVFNHGERYTLHIKARSVRPEYRKYLDEIMESHKLGIRESKRYLIIYDRSRIF
jgi:hypothetical protein